MSHLSNDQKVRLFSCLVEGNSIRSTERLTGIHRDTILRHLRAVGEGCNRLHDALFSELHCNLLEVDEVWGYVGKKAKRVRPEDPAEFGDQYCFTALDSTRKAIISYAIGKRDSDTADAFAYDLRHRIVNRPQISTDGYKPYLDAITRAFDGAVDHVVVIKEYGKEDGASETQRRYSPPKCTSMQKRRIAGQPDMDKANTSYIERSNLTLRMGCRRLTRLTNAYSKRLRNHAAAVALSIAYYNFCRPHEALEKRTTPAVALGITDHAWTIGELIDAALSILPDDEPGPEPSAGPEAPPSGPILTPPAAPPSLPALSSPILPVHVQAHARQAQIAAAVATIRQLALFPESVLDAAAAKQAG